MNGKAMERRREKGRSAAKKRQKRREEKTRKEENRSQVTVTVSISSNGGVVPSFASGSRHNQTLSRSKFTRCPFSFSSSFFPLLFLAFLVPDYSSSPIFSAPDSSSSSPPLPLPVLPYLELFIQVLFLLLLL